MPFLVVPMLFGDVPYLLAVRVRDEEETKTHEDRPSSTSFSPSTIWWKSKTRCARSEMKSLPVQSRPVQ